RRGCVRHHSEALFALAKSGLRLSFSRTLPQQSKDQQRLKNNEDNPSDDVLLISLPDGRLAVQNQGVRRQRRFGDVPAAKLTPIDLGLGACAVYYRNVFRFHSRKDTGGEFASS